MNSRERTFLALKHMPSDRIPVDFWATPAVARNLEAALGRAYAQFLDDFGVDLRYIEGPAYIGPALAPGCDIWGVARAAVQAGAPGQSESYSEVTSAPLGGAGTPEEIYAYRNWPDPDMFDYTAVERQCDAILRENRVVVFMGDRLNRVAQLKPAMYLRGVEQILLDLALQPEIAQALFERITAFYLEYACRTFEAAEGGLDVFMMGDDFGTQTGPLLSPAMWRQFLRPGFQALVALGKRFGLTVAHHTCGAVEPLLSDLLACGLDVLNPLQPDAAGMDHAAIKARFGGRLAFHGGISIQRALPFGTPDDVRAEVAERIRTLAPGGGYILCTAHNLQPDTPLANLEALFDAYHALGRYPQSLG